MKELHSALKSRLFDMGAVLADHGDMRFAQETIDALGAAGLYTGVSIAVRIRPDIIRGIAAGPGPAYFEEYNRLNRLLDSLGTEAETMLLAAGYKAQARTRARVEVFGAHMTALPHKTAAVRAGLGWIGKSNLLVTKEYGSAVRITTVLTDAPLPHAEPVTASSCGNCTACAEACPAGALTGRLWVPGADREERVDVERCADKAKELMGAFGITEEICGKCIEVCPYTRRYLKRAVQ